MFAGPTIIFPLYIEHDLEILLLLVMSFIAVIVYTVSIIICKIKIKKNNDIQPKSNKLKIVLFVLILLPLCLFLITYLKERYLINNSDLVLVYHSSGNGGFGDGETFAYAISDNYCEQISLGTATWGYHIDEFLPKDAIEIDNIDDFNGYKIVFNEERKDNSISVYKNGKKICKKKNKAHYFNISYKRGFSLNQD